jgi:hypothetical protein
MSKAKHVLGISGGKDSAALAIYMKLKYPNFNIEYYTCDTGKELDETYEVIDKLEVFLGKKILKLTSTKEDDNKQNPFDHFLAMYGGFLPSANARWCTKKLKLEPFEKYIGTEPVVSYVGIRGDEEREGYISTKANIQSIFPFRKNIWSEDVVLKVLSNTNISTLLEVYSQFVPERRKDTVLDLVRKPISSSFIQPFKLEKLLEFDTKLFNRVVFEYIKAYTGYPLAAEDVFPVIENDEVVVRDDVFKMLRESGVGVPKYYDEVEFEIDGKKGFYFRSRSGCFFCFFQQKIEWVWLFEQHPELFSKAMEYEKEGYTWMQDEKLEDLIRPERIRKIKLDQLKRLEKLKGRKSDLLLDILDGEEGVGCAACFI